MKPHLEPKFVSSSKFFVIVETPNFVILNFYFSPALDAIVVVEEVSKCLCDINLYKPCIVAGDFNSRVDVDGVERTELLLDLMEDFGFQLLNNHRRPTYFCHNGSSVIDLVFINFSCGVTAVEEDEDLFFFENTSLFVLL